MHENATHRAAKPAPHGAETAGAHARPRGVLRVVIDIVLLWWDRGRQRRALAMLSDDLLRDIGISRREARSESSKSPWHG